MDAVYGKAAAKAKCFRSSSAENCLVNIVSQAIPASSEGIAPIPRPSEALLGAAPSPFLSKTYDMIDDPNTDDIVSWSSGNNSFIIWNSPQLGESILPNYFKHNNFSSFVRQLNTYGFRKVDPDRWEFAAEGFLRGQKHLLKTMHRRRHVNTHENQTQQKAGMVGFSLEARKFGGEVEQLKRAKKLLKNELVEMRQQQQSADQTVRLLGQRLAATEERQRQMMTFLAKTSMQNPSIFANLLVHQNDANTRIGSLRIRRKRQMPKQEQLTQRGDSEASSSEGFIPKHQGAIINPAKAASLTDNVSNIPPSASIGMTCNLLKELFHGSIEQESRGQSDDTSTSDSDPLNINPSENFSSVESKQVSKDIGEGFTLARSSGSQYLDGADWTEIFESLETYNRSKMDEEGLHFSASAFAEQEQLEAGIENIECSEHSGLTKQMKDSDSDLECS